MSNNHTLPAVVATGAIVLVANAIEKTDSKNVPRQILGIAVYLFAMAAINQFAPQIASKLALLVLVGVLLTRGPVVLETTIEKTNVNAPRANQAPSGFNGSGGNAGSGGGSW